MSKRLLILDAISAKLSDIRITNQYNSEIGARVFYWQDLDFEYGEVGAVAFRDLYEDMADKNQPYQMSLTVEIRAIKFTDNPLVDSCALLDDLIKATKDENWNGHALKTNLVHNEKEIETAGKKAIKVMLKIKIMYRE